MSNKPIYVTQPFLPPLEEFTIYLEQIWKSKILTNDGPFHQQLEKALCEYLGVDHVALFNNGTIALITALKALGIKGEVITTPYSFVATANSLVWNGIKPVFVDIDPNTLNLDPSKIEAAITSNTTAIMPVHCYGNPCDVEAIQEIADRHNLKVIYDAAHAFGVQCHCGSILNHGDLSVLSFHATKVFNTFEGGAIICKDAATKLQIDQLKNFGFFNETSVILPGINGKMNEVSAAFGILQLKYIDNAIAARKKIDAIYRNLLKNVNGIRCLSESRAEAHNYSYFPILIDVNYSLSRDDLHQKLRNANIYARRYFYPLISNFPIYQRFPSSSLDNLPFANAAANQVLCLPIYPGISESDIEIVVSVLNQGAI